MLIKSARRCVLCFHLDGDLHEKPGQIAHLDSDRTNGTEDNLAWMCMMHHSQFDSATSQHKNYQITEVKIARRKLYAAIRRGLHQSTAPVARKTHPALDEPLPQQQRPKVVAVRLAASVDGDREGLYLVNDGAPAYEVQRELSARLRRTVPTREDSVGLRGTKRTARAGYFCGE